MQCNAVGLPALCPVRGRDRSSGHSRVTTHARHAQKKPAEAEARLPIYRCTWLAARLQPMGCPAQRRALCYSWRRSHACMRGRTWRAGMRCWTAPRCPLWLTTPRLQRMARPRQQRPSPMTRSLTSSQVRCAAGRACMAACTGVGLARRTTPCVRVPMAVCGAHVPRVITNGTHVPCPVPLLSYVCTALLGT